MLEAAGGWGGGGVNSVFPKCGEASSMHCLPFGFAPTPQTLWDRFWYTVAGDSRNGLFLSGMSVLTVTEQGYRADRHGLSLTAPSFYVIALIHF